MLHVGWGDDPAVGRPQRRRAGQDRTKSAGIKEERQGSVSSVRHDVAWQGVSSENYSRKVSYTVAQSGCVAGNGGVPSQTEEAQEPNLYKATGKAKVGRSAGRGSGCGERE